MKIDREQSNKNEDNLLQFAFNDSLVNHNFTKILDILSKKIKSSKQLLKDKKAVISLLEETFPGITAEQLSNGFNLMLADSQEYPFKNETLKDIEESINRFSRYILEISKEFKDHGYSMLVCFYFWITRNFK